MCISAAVLRRKKIPKNLKFELRKSKFENRKAMAMALTMPPPPRATPRGPERAGQASFNAPCGGRLHQASFKAPCGASLAHTYVCTLHVKRAPRSCSCNKNACKRTRKYARTYVRTYVLHCQFCAHVRFRFAVQLRHTIFNDFVFIFLPKLTQARWEAESARPAVTSCLNEAVHARTISLVNLAGVVAKPPLSQQGLRTHVRTYVSFMRACVRAHASGYVYNQSRT